MSSKLTAAQVISLGEYLNQDFDPASLTVSQLLGVLGFHNIQYPSPYTKPKLVQVFNNEIKPNASKLRKQRLKVENSVASDDGIVDGVTGKPIGGTKTVARPARRSSRRLSRAPSEDQDVPVARPDPPKRRRSSAQPSLGGPSRKADAPVIEPALAEESEPEEDSPVRKVGRSKKSAQAGRRSSAANEDSGWEDNNIFQSGAESSSPAQPVVRSKTTRKSVVARKPRKASSAPPQSSPPSSPGRPTYEHFVPPSTKFEPAIPKVDSPTRQIPQQTARTTFSPVEPKVEAAQLTTDDADESVDELDVIGDDPHVVADDGYTAEDSYADEGDASTSPGYANEDAEHALAVSRKIAEGGTVARLSPSTQPTSKWKLMLYLVLSLAGLFEVGLYKKESQPIGFCDTGRDTNAALEELRTRDKLIEACNAENRTYLHPPSMFGKQDQTPCPPPSLNPLPRPDACTPCPTNATCSQHSVTCDTGYLLKSHPLLPFVPPSQNTANTEPFDPLHASPGELVWKTVSLVADGLPGLGPVAFPPRCAEDPIRKKHIGQLGNALDNFLAKHRGSLLCNVSSAHPSLPDREGGEAKRWGMPIKDLKNTMRQNLKSKIKNKESQSRSLAAFDDTFNEAIQQLLQWGGVFIGEDSKGTRYIAHKTASMSLACSLIVKSRQTWVNWRPTVLGAVVFVVSLYVLKFRRASRKIENKRVAELIQIALDTLRNQEIAHHTDPVTAPQPYLSSLQLRDLILQDEHSIPTRRRLWDQVERVVEGNANVRANLEEVQGGDELRVWRWVGSATPTRRRIAADAEDKE